MGTRAGILLRLSEEKDNAQATAEAFERFEAACRRRCELEGWEVSEPLFTDGVVSAYKGKRREGFDAAMVALREGEIDVLVVSDLDRLLRSWKDAATVDEVIRESGRTVVSSDGRDVAADPYYAVHVGIAISESKRISKRVKAQAAQAKAKGRPQPSPRAFGYEPGGMVVREPEARIVREVVRRLLAGEPMGAIVRDLASRGIVGTRGGSFSSTSLRGVITSPRIAAKPPATWPAIISETDLQAVRAIFDRRQGRPYNPGRVRTYAYSGLLTCSVCHGRLVGSGGAYRCPEPCRKSYVSADHFEAAMDRRVLDYVTSEKFRQRVNLRLAELGDSADDLSAALEADRAELADSREMPARYRTAEHDAREVELEQAIERTEARLATVPGLAALADLPGTRAALEAAWSSWTAEQRHARLVAVLKHIDVLPAHGRHVFDPERIVPHWR
jgi:site-specific DNA recombinase